MNDKVKAKVLELDVLFERLKLASQKTYISFEQQESIMNDINARKALVLTTLAHGDESNALNLLDLKLKAFTVVVEFYEKGLKK